MTRINVLLNFLRRRPLLTVLFLAFNLPLAIIIVRNNNDLQGLGDEFDTNFGIDCDEVQKILKGEIKDKQIVDVKFELSTDYLFGPKNKSSEVMHFRPVLNCLAPDDPHVVEVIRNEFILPPAPYDLPYNLVKPKSSEMSIFDDEKIILKNANENKGVVSLPVATAQAIDVMEVVFGDQRNGFFIEAGAADCEDSVTLPLERFYNWTGLLVEAVPKFFSDCKKKNRKAKLINTCVATQNHPHFVDFDTASAGNFVSKTGEDTFVMAGISQSSTSIQKRKMQCMPLYSLILALGSPTVNLLVLDIEGFELATLRTVPWDKVDIQVLSVETDLAGKFMEGSPEDIFKLMEDAGYERFVHRDNLNERTGRIQNHLFVRKDIVKKYHVVKPSWS